MNNNKLREALSEISNLADALDIDNPNVVAILDRCRDALAEPVRNCDLSKVVEDPWRAWLDDKSNWDEFGSPKLEIHDWLLAPATEKEGGAK